METTCHPHVRRPLPAIAPLLFFAVLAALSAGGCGTEVRYVDAPVYMDDEEQDATWAQGDPALLMGIYEEQLFRELSPGDVVRVRRTPDPGGGGDTQAHINLALRVTGMSRRGVVEAEVRRGAPGQEGDADVLGRIREELVLTPTREGFLEVQQLRVPAPGAAPGRPGFIEIRYQGERATTETTCPVIWTGDP